MATPGQTPLPLSDEQCRTLVDSLVEGVMIVNEAQKITFINPAFARMLGLTAADILGHPSSEFIDDAARVAMLGNIEPGNADNAQTYEHTWLRENGALIPTLVSLRATFDSERRRSGALRIVSDLSDLRCMQAARDQLARIVENSRDGIIGRDSNGLVTSWNKGAEEIFGYTAAEIVGRNIDLLATPDRPGEVAELLCKVRGGEQVARYETGRTTKAGRRIDVAVTLSPTSDNAQSAPGTWTFVRDISARKHTERERDLGAAVNSAVQRVSLDGILLVDAQEKIISYNQQFVEMWRVPPESLIGKSDVLMLEAVAGQVADREAFVARVADLYAHLDQTSRDEIPLKNGRTLDRYSAPVRLEDGTYLGRVWFFQDITERKRAANIIREDASQFRALVEQQIAGIFIISGDGTLAYVNPRFTELLGYMPAEVIGRPFLDVVADADRDAVHATFAAHLHGGPPTTQTVTAIKRKDGGLVDVLAHASIASYMGKPALIGIVVDITEGKRATDLLQASEERFRLLVEQAPDAIAVYDVDTDRFVNTNKTAAILFGCSREELLKMGPSHFFPPTVPDGRSRAVAFDGRSSQALAGMECVFEQHFRNAQGREVTCEVRLVRLPTVAGRLLRASFIDITERRQAELALRASEERLRTVFDSVSDAIVVYDIAAGAVIDTNPRVFEMFGYTREEMLKLDLTALLTGVSPHTLEDVTPLLKSAASGAALTIEWSCKAKNGITFWIEVSLRKTHFGGREILLATARDITERSLATHALTYRDSILHAVTLSVTDLVTAPSLAAGMPKALQRAAKALHVDRMLILESSSVRARTTAVSMVHAWQAPEVPNLDMAAISRFSPDEPEFAAWLAPLLAGKPVATYSATASGAVGQLMREMHNLSTLLVPISVAGKYWGQIGIDDCKAERHWTPTELDMLGTLSQVIGALIVREQAQSSLQNSEERFRAVSDTAQDAIIMVDSAGKSPTGIARRSASSATAPTRPSVEVHTSGSHRRAIWRRPMRA